MTKRSLVSIVMTAFAHETTIVKAIEGVLMQKCDFNVELIIANDASPDETHVRVEEYLARVTIPTNVTIRYTNHEVNKRMMDNIIWTLKQVRGKYIAVCEGDDYWIDPCKLQKQADFLEANKEYGLVNTNYKRFFAKTGKFKEHQANENIERKNENEYYLHTGDIRT